MRVRVIIFTWLAVLATPGRFLPLFYQAHGLSDAQIGLIFSLSMLLSLFTTPALGAAADRTASKSGVISRLHGLRFLAFFAHLLVYPGFGPLLVMRFPYLLACGIAFRALGDPVIPIVTAMCVEQLRAIFGAEGHLRFGRERAWGAVSWAIMSLLQGVLLDLPGVGMWVMYPIAVATALMFTVSLRCFDAEPSRENYKPVPPQLAGLQGEDDPGTPSNAEDGGWVAVFRAIFAEAGVAGILFFVLNFWLGAGMLIVERLMFLYFVNELGASNLLCGLTVVVTILFEAPLFTATPALLRRYGSAALMLVGTCAFVVRVLWYAAAPNAWLILAVEPMHGVTYAFTNAASVAYVADRAPDAMQARAQALLSTTNMAGAMLGVGTGGAVMQVFGAPALCVVAAGVLAVVGITFGVVDEWAKRNARRPSPDPLPLASVSSVRQV